MLWFGAQPIKKFPAPMRESAAAFPPLRKALSTGLLTVVLRIVKPFGPFMAAGMR